MHLAANLPRRKRLSYWSERRWSPFSKIHKVWSTSTTWRRAKRSQDSGLTPHCNTLSHLKKKQLLYHHDNSSAHSFAGAITHLVELGYELLLHPSYSSDLAPYGFFLIPVRNFSRMRTLSPLPTLKTFRNTFSKWVKKVEESLSQLYRAKKRLCWEINRNFFKLLIFLLRAKYLLDPS